MTRKTVQQSTVDSYSPVQLASCQVVRLPTALKDKVAQQPGRIPKHVSRLYDAQRARQARLDAQWRIQHRLEQIETYQKIVRDSEAYLDSTRAWLVYLIETPIAEVLHAKN